MSKTIRETVAYLFHRHDWTYHYDCSLEEYLEGDKYPKSRVCNDCNEEQTTW